MLFWKYLLTLTAIQEQKLKFTGKVMYRAQIAKSDCSDFNLIIINSFIVWNIGLLSYRDFFLKK